MHSAYDPPTILLRLRRESAIVLSSSGARFPLKDYSCYYAVSVQLAGLAPIFFNEFVMRF